MLVAGVAAVEQKARLVIRAIYLQRLRVAQAAPGVVAVLGYLVTGLIANRANAAQMVAVEVVELPLAVFLAIYRRSRVGRAAGYELRMILPLQANCVLPTDIAAGIRPKEDEQAEK